MIFGDPMGRLATAVALALLPAAAAAQTDYFNTDAGRPILVEDAYALERRGFEVQLAPVRIERSAGGTYRWGLEPELAFGVLPRTQLEVGIPLVFLDPGGAPSGTGVGGVEISLLYNLNVETSIPALGLAAEVVLPVGEFAPDDAYASVKGIVTRSFRWARVHLNGQYTFGPEPSLVASGTGPRGIDLSRWWGGVAVDRAFPLRSLLLTGEVVAHRPIGADVTLAWATGIGARYQLSPRWTLDGGVGRELTGDDRTWYATVGTAYAFGLPWGGRLVR